MEEAPEQSDSLFSFQGWDVRICSDRRTANGGRHRNLYAVLLQEASQTNIFFLQALRLSKSGLQVQEFGIRCVHFKLLSPSARP
jgi:hypothetical protein